MLFWGIWTFDFPIQSYIKPFSWYKQMLFVLLECNHHVNQKNDYESNIIIIMVTDLN